ncbi:MAG TPA: DEAD/DEAH box helicase [Fimbriiglobus sp.]|jgi:SNF2 family DNA or RNA helicase
MLREEQIDLRRRRAKAGRFLIHNLGKNRVHSDFRVTNPETGGAYTVSVRGFDLGDNACTCPDFKANTLGTCKHVEAVLESLKELPEQVRRKKATPTRPEVVLDYGDPVRPALRLPKRRSERLAAFARRFFDDRGLWSGKGRFEDLVPTIEALTEEVAVRTDALDFVDREIERVEMRSREDRWLAELDAGTFGPPLLAVPLYDYQIRGALFLACRGRSILGDDMGLGKTIQALAAVELLARHRGIGRVLVVAPASVKYQWESEIRKFTPRAVQIVEGSPEERKTQYATPTFYRLVNYEQVVRDRDAINAWAPDVVILDEAQRIKNWQSKTSRAVKSLTSRYAMVLTGTPLENRLEELYSIVAFVDERRFGPAFQFLHDHVSVDAKGNVTGYRNLSAIREKLAPVFLRRTRAEVLGQLPPRTDSTVVVDLAPEQRGRYEEQAAALARLLRKGFLSELDRTRVLATLVNLRTVCDSTFLVDKETHVSPKLDEFAELVPELLQDGGHKLVVFSQWETMIREAASVLDRLKVGYAILHGGLSGPDRQAVLTRFHGEPSCRAFLSTDAGGTGLNLQVADTVMNLELPWNPAVLEQRIARVHRMGQKNPVRVVNFVTRGTVEERVLRTLESKRDLFAGVFAGEDDDLAFSAVTQETVLDGLRVLLGEKPDDPPPTPPAADTASVLAEAAVRVIEAAVEGLAAQPVPPPLRTRLAGAVDRLTSLIGPERPA